MSQYRRGSGPNRTTASTPRAGSPGMGPGHPDRQTLTPLRTSSPSHLDQTQSTTNRRASRPSNVIPSEAMHTGNPEARGPVEDARLLVNFSTGKQDTLPDSAAAALLAPLGEEVAAAHVLSSLSDPQNRLSAPKPLQGGQNRLDETRARRYVAPKSRSASIARGASPSVLHGSRAVSAVLKTSSSKPQHMSRSTASPPTVIPKSSAAGRPTIPNAAANISTPSPLTARTLEHRSAFPADHQVFNQSAASKTSNQGTPGDGTTTSPLAPRGRTPPQTSAAVTGALSSGSSGTLPVTTARAPILVRGRPSSSALSQNRSVTPEAPTHPPGRPSVPLPTAATPARTPDPVPLKSSKGSSYRYLDELPLADPPNNVDFNDKEGTITVRFTDYATSSKEAVARYFERQRTAQANGSGMTATPFPDLSKVTLQGLRQFRDQYHTLHPGVDWLADPKVNWQARTKLHVRVACDMPDEELEGRGLYSQKSFAAIKKRLWPSGKDHPKDKITICGEQKPISFTMNKKGIYVTRDHFPLVFSTVKAGQFRREIKKFNDDSWRTSALVVDWQPENVALGAEFLTLSEDRLAQLQITPVTAMRHVIEKLLRERLQGRE